MPALRAADRAAVAPSVIAKPWGRHAGDVPLADDATCCRGRCRWTERDIRDLDRLRPHRMPRAHRRR